MRYPNSTDLVEALAASKAISFAKELIIHQMVVEGDSLRFIQAINDASQYGLCMDLLLMILEFCLPLFVVIFCMLSERVIISSCPYS